MQEIRLILVINPPVPIMSIPQPTLLEEPPIPVGLRAELESQQNRPSVSLVLPTKAESQKPVLGLNSADDPSATLSQQEELSVKGKSICPSREVSDHLFCPTTARS